MECRNEHHSELDRAHLRGPRTQTHIKEYAKRPSARCTHALHEIDKSTGSLQKEQSSWLGCRSLVAALESQMRCLAPDEVWCRRLSSAEPRATRGDSRGVAVSASALHSRPIWGRTTAACHVQAAVLIQRLQSIMMSGFACRFPSSGS
ncbi:uncharacterized protein LAESUDRAFT_422629 [Laetiporus sulphureus 93-53]|uniref:Uncharacterized protein n=1 Tax=Laetiporus sulphureus 93-53 TaxID=1314785 RepID=A0A165GHS6_9APHY|nr:uncharacterized protein LAESUDRAFT_422629 [Laetiporus sulphureus 93-53]KZT10367.1 hypothetical protein LAESUDRAFT_422629 [Laetiporus sulphureus 93-53]